MSGGGPCSGAAGAASIVFNGAMASRYRRRSSKLAPLGNVLSRASALRGRAPKPPPIDDGVWTEAVGTRIARRAQPNRLAGRCLEITVGSAAWANELSLLAPEILAQLQRRGVNVESLRFRVGKLPERPRFRKGAPSKERILGGELEPALQDTIDDVDDDDLRAAIADAAARSVTPRG